MNIIHRQPGSNAPIKIQLFNADTGAAHPLSGATSLSATAIDTQTGTNIAFSNVVLTDAANGIMQLEYNPSTFPSASYNISVTYTDGSGFIQKYPRNIGDVKLIVA